MARHFKLTLMGAPELRTSDGADVTPRSSKAKALLAILAVSQGRPWNRASLQDLLWSDRGPTHGRDSLKKALRELRDSLNRDGQAPLQSGGGPVALDMSCVAVDIFDQDPETAALAAGGQGFLAGLEVRDPQFEEWLRVTRSAIGARKIAPAPVVGDGMHRHRIHLAIMPASCLETDGVARLVGDLFLDRLVFALRQYDVYRVCDYRQAARHGAAGADISLCLSAGTFGPSMVASLKCVRPRDGEVLWGRRIHLPTEGFGSGRFGQLVTEVLDQVTDAVFRGRALGEDERDRAARHAMDGIDRIFRLSAPELDRAAQSFRKAIDMDPRGSYIAWYAYLSAFELEAKKGRNLQELKDRTEALARRALEMDPWNPLTRSLLTHVCSFLFRDFDRAEAMIAPLASDPPDLPLYHQSLALLRYYTGDVKGARTFADRANLLGANSPNAYWFKTTQAIVETAAGNYGQAITFGEQALLMQRGRPVAFMPALRYLAAAYALNGERDAARAVLSRIHADTPDFHLGQMLERNFPIPSENARALLIGAFGSLAE